MLREQLWSVSWGTLFRSVRGCAGSQRWGTVWSRGYVLLFNNYSLVQPELRQNNGSTLPHKVVVPSLSCMGQQGREKNCIAWWVWYTLFGDKCSKPFICFRSFALCLCLHFMSACSFSGTILFISTSFGKQKIALLGPFNHDLFHMGCLCSFPSAGNSSCNSQNFCLLAFCSVERSEGLLQTVAKHKLQ